MNDINDDLSDRFYGLIHNYVVTKSGEKEYQPLISHPYADLDEPLAHLCDALEKSNIHGFYEIAVNLASNELNFFAFTDALRTILYVNEAGMTYMRVIGAITSCGVYAKHLIDMDEKDDLPKYYYNAERYKNQINQSILYMSKILDMEMARQWTPENGLSFDGFCQYLLENHRIILPQNEESSLVSPVLIATSLCIGLVTIIAFKFCSNNTYFT